MTIAVNWHVKSQTKQNLDEHDRANINVANLNLYISGGSELDNE